MPGGRAVDPVSLMFSKILFEPPIFPFFSTKILLPNAYSLYFDAEILLQQEYPMSHYLHGKVRKRSANSRN